jgi:hypothetical protein
MLLRCRELKLVINKFIQRLNVSAKVIVGGLAM